MFVTYVTSVWGGECVHSARAIAAASVGKCGCERARECECECVHSARAIAAASVGKCGCEREYDCECECVRSVCAIAAACPASTISRRALSATAWRDGTSCAGSGGQGW